jgi:hypothetical protein
MDWLMVLFIRIKTVEYVQSKNEKLSEISTRKMCEEKQRSVDGKC